MKAKVLATLSKVGAVILFSALVAVLYLVGHVNFGVLLFGIICLIPGLILATSLFFAFSRMSQSRKFESEFAKNFQNAEWLLKEQSELRVQIDSTLWGIGKQTLRERLLRINNAIDKLNHVTDIHSIKQYFKLGINKVEMIKIIDSLYRIGSFSKPDGHRVDKKDVMLVFGKLFGQDWSSYSRNLSTVYRETSIEKNLALFEVLKLEIEEEIKLVK